MGSAGPGQGEALDAGCVPYGLRATSEMLWTPYFTLALRARSEMNSYGFRRISSIASPASPIAC